MAGSFPAVPGLNAVSPQPPVTVAEGGVPRDQRWLGVLVCLASSALSITATVRLVF
jgi:hypothetical protein